MSDLYGPNHRRLQDAHGSRRLADRLQDMAHETLAEDERAFVAAASMFFLSTVDHEGRPTVSYKGGPPGFVRLLGEKHLVFPWYDGNGMFLSLGNIDAGAPVGLLFIDFEAPRRLRVQGNARILEDAALLASYPGAKTLVAVETTDIFVNCGRYIHKADGIRLSSHLPDADGSIQPFPGWKRIDAFGDVISADDQRRVETEGGTIPFDQYRGEPA